MFRRITIAIMMAVITVQSFSQTQEELSLAEQFLALEQEIDSLSIFNLIDSALFLNTARSEMSLRLGFTSSVTSAGRDYNINQVGYTTGLSYFHSSGAYLDLSGYWNSDVDPVYNPTILSGGYLGSFANKWNYSFDYEHWFYNPKDSSENPLTNSLSSSLTYNFSKLSLSGDYSYLFGKETAHRIIGTLSGTLELGKFWVFKNVYLFPSVSMMAGNGDITTLRITTEQISNQERQYIERLTTLAGLTDRQKEQLRQYIFTALSNEEINRERALNLLTLIEISGDITPEELAELNEIAMNGIESAEFIDGGAFGILNYSFSLPLSLSTDKLSILLSYTYSIPVKLPGEIFDIDPLGYFAASISFRIPY